MNRLGPLASRAVAAFVVSPDLYTSQTYLGSISEKMYKPPVTYQDVDRVWSIPEKEKQSAAFFELLEEALLEESISSPLVTHIISCIFDKEMQRKAQEKAEEIVMPRRLEASRHSDK